MFVTGYMCPLLNHAKEVGTHGRSMSIDCVGKNDVQAS